MLNRWIMRWRVWRGAGDMTNQVLVLLFGLDDDEAQPNHSISLRAYPQGANLNAQTLYVAGISSNWRCSTAVSRC